MKSGHTHESKFAPGDMVMFDDIRMRVITVKFKWGQTFPVYFCGWFDSGQPQSAEFMEPELARAE